MRGEPGRNIIQGRTGINGPKGEKGESGFPGVPGYEGRTVLVSGPAMDAVSRCVDRYYANDLAPLRDDNTPDPDYKPTPQTVKTKHESVVAQVVNDPERSKLYYLIVFPEDVELDNSILSKGNYIDKVSFGVWVDPDQYKGSATLPDVLHLFSITWNIFQKANCHDNSVRKTPVSSKRRN